MKNDPRMIHETIVRDIMDVVSAAKNFDEIEWLQSRNKTGSIAKRADALTLVFPVLTSTAISIGTASIITKALEKKCATLLQILFSSMQITNADNMYDYLAKFHKNLSFNDRMNLDDFIDAVDTIANEGGAIILDKGKYDAVKADLKNICYYLNEDYNTTSLNDYRIKKNYYGESYVSKKYKPKEVVNEGGGRRGRPRFEDEEEYFVYNGGVAHYLGPDNAEAVFVRDNGSWRPATVNDFDIDDQTGELLNLKQQFLSNNNNSYRALGAINTYNATHQQNNEPVRRMAQNLNRTTNISRDEMEYFNNQLKQSDIDKANELVPTTCVINFTTITDSDQAIRTSGVIGVKCKLYAIDSMEIINRITAKYTSSNTLFNFIRATTREISFFKDFAFAIDKAKLDAVNMAKNSNNARIFKMLERRAAKNKFMNLLKKNDASPITSLIISQDEVEYLKKYHSIDMERTHVTRNILDKYNLMDIVIADETLETAKFLFDDEADVFEVLPFDALEKSAKDTSYKKVINLMNKINR